MTDHKPAPHADRDGSERPSIVGMVDSHGRPATAFTPPEDLRRDPARWPTPAEFVAEWEQYTPTQRLQLAERVIADGQTVADALRLTYRIEAADAARDRLERLADTLAGRAVELEDRARAAEAERDRLRATVARVEALATEYARRRSAADRKRRGSAQRYKAAELWLRAALSAPEAAQAPQERAETGLGRDGDASGHSGAGEAL